MRKHRAPPQRLAADGPGADGQSGRRTRADNRGLCDGNRPGHGCASRPAEEAQPVCFAVRLDTGARQRR